VSLSSPGVFKTYADLWEGQNHVSPLIKELKVPPGQVRVIWAVPEPGMGNLHTHAILSCVFSVSPELSLILAFLTPRSSNSNTPRMGPSNVL
jgi:hypothetical protein